MTTVIYTGATVFPAHPDNPATLEAFAVRGGKFGACGSLTEVRAAHPDASEVQLDGTFVLPGIIDSHTHLVEFGTSLTKVQLRDCKTLAEIQERLQKAHRENPAAQRILGIGWLFDAVPDGTPTAAMLDAVLPDVPVYLDANDLHSCWVNSAALAEMGITRDTPDPLGGEIARDAAGSPTGMLYETACTQHAWEFLRSTRTQADTVHALDLAFAEYLRVGVTGCTEMSLNQAEVDALLAIIARDGRLPFPMTAHWLLEPSGDTAKDLSAVQAIAQLRDEIAASPAAPWLRIAGVKFIMDGVIDACTATMREPYANGSNAEPIWNAERLLPVAAAADRLGLQFAMHAIGDRTSEIALDAIAHCVRENGPRHSRRPRIEHLESATRETSKRMADLGVVASMQPVHCDPAVLDNWQAMLGDARADTGFAWQWFRDAGVHMTLGTDAPTAPHQPLPNLYIALTAASVLDPARPPYHAERVFSPAAALTALTAGSAYAAGEEERVGQIAPGQDANFIVLDVNPLTAEPAALLDAQVRASYVAGECAYAAA